MLKVSQAAVSFLTVLGFWQGAMAKESVSAADGEFHPGLCFGPIVLVAN